ncbi:hypothetical protein OBBRIDRAFT_805079 [Obba rivulosa]|uniref:Uncharacterized protein n=1 Tax=Obba rivulosa TaxID=1052685 RepID=A0A8E2ATD3_9APHY|nr:hypothetical protein OBBRIDRAFT_805079 [Obba rivulosa]
MAAIDWHLDSTLGVLQISRLLSAVLYGITIIQTYVYFHQSSYDSILYKVAQHFGFDGADLAVAFVSACMDTGVRFLFCLRIWKLSGKKWILTIIILACSVVILWKLHATVPRTKSVVQSLIIYSINTGLWASTFLTPAIHGIKDVTFAVPKYRSSFHKEKISVTCILNTAPFIAAASALHCGTSWT